MEETLDKRVEELEKKVADLRATVLRLTPNERIGGARWVCSGRTTCPQKPIDSVANTASSSVRPDPVLVLGTNHVTVLGYASELGQSLLHKLEVAGQETATTMVCVGEQLASG